ncbi:MAG TPA: DMT family transporter [Steroidobacteraceae bacterium]|nr:DMT family transporter [Steroidobacteraceae bacterium]
MLAALGAALLFGAATPLAKRLLQTTDPWLLAGLLYLGSGVGLALYRRLVHAAPVRMAKSEILWFAGAVAAGGVIAPVLLMFGLRGMPASGASLLLNAEGALTALLAWFVFKENFDRRIAWGVVFIVAGAAILTWKGEVHLAGLWPALAVLGACFAWGIDNNLTRKVSLSDATWIASTKGLAAGTLNLVLAMCLGAQTPAIRDVAGATIIGFLAYGVSLSLFVVALRQLGTARTGAYFSVAPFFGAVLALLLGDSITPQLPIAAALMAAGVWLHLTERHEHEHVHEALEHEHEHVHGDDPHHDHEHVPPVAPGTRHTHRHRHKPLRHSHAHFPDAHHRHGH